MASNEMIILAILHSGLALLTVALNLYVLQRRLSATAKVDARKLRKAFAAELAALRDLYKQNLDTLFAGRDVLASCRMVQGIYRGNLARMQALDESEISPIVSAYAASEMAEALAAAHGRAHGQCAFSLPKERLFLDEMIAAYERASAAAERALRVVQENEAGVLKAVRAETVTATGRAETLREAAA